MGFVCNKFMSNDKIENNNKLYIRYSGGISQFSYQSLIKNLQHHINSARFNELYLCISPSCLIYIGIEIYNYLKSLKDIKIITHFLTYNNKTTANKKIICEGSTTSYIFNQGTGTVLYLPFELCPIIRLVAIFINIDLWE